MVVKYKSSLRRWGIIINKKWKINKSEINTSIVTQEMKDSGATYSCKRI